MKKYISMLIAVMMVTTLAACSSLVEKGEQARKDEEYIAAQQSPSSANSESSSPSYLSETYTNEAEGISFKYTNGWKIGLPSEQAVYFDISINTELTMIDYLLAPLENGNFAPAMNIRKTPSNQEMMNTIFSMTIDNIMPEGNMMAVDIEDTSVDSIPSRKVTFHAKKGNEVDLVIIRYIYFIDFNQYRVEFISSPSSMEFMETVINDIMASYKITKDDTASTTPSSEVSSSESFIDAGQDGFMIVTAEPSLRMRSGEGTEYDIVTEIPYGEVVEILNDINPEWIEVRYGEYFGYVLGEYLAPVGSSSITPNEAIKIIYDIVGEGYIIAIDREEGNAYVVQVYTVNNGTTATLDWFTVDKSTGAVEASFGYFDSVG